MTDERLSFADPWPAVRLGAGLGVPVAIGGELTPGALLGAHRRAIFCQPRCDEPAIARDEATYRPDVHAGDITVLPASGSPYAILWWSPAVRYVIPVAALHLNRSLRRTIRDHDWSTTLDTDFDGVIAGCRAGREPRWITDQLVAVLRALKDAGWVHTVEVWSGGDELIGGLFGCVVGGVFIMESAFHRASDAAKVAIADLARRAAGGGITLLDTEVKSDYTVQMGAIPMPRDDYRAHLASTDGPGTVQAGRRRARDLLAAESPA
ncbi:MAG TPA: leucyl/phenylalanyl-tRNA--protein transferase [Streptosporangiaceae bacterium]|nr:leucyl/phenylalanyl-tRNA--protein transferase [Streptosporangiaceae bacterium]